VLFLALWAILLLVPGPDIPFQASQPGVADNLEENGDLYESQRPWPRLVFVIDDVGYSLEELQPFLELPFPLTFAVLPFLENSRASLDRILASGHEAILHMPMEPLGDRDPGPGAVKTLDSPDEAALKVETAIKSLPGISGVNNHMGSAVTSDMEIMKRILQTVEDQGLYYLDSFTTAGSQVKEAGRSLGIQTLRRDVFLDNKKNKEYILKALEEGRELAKKEGHAVMIGHVWTEELAGLLLELYPEALDEGYTLEELSVLLTGDTGDARSGN
jgi:polysaccharide deacetylase 2 family uncharacterized protein YibQ